MQLDNYTDEELVAMPRPNIKLLDEVLDYIIEHPDQWDQGEWGEQNEFSSCGATFCFAGHAAYLRGLVTFDRYGPTLSGEYKEQGWHQTGQELLGLTEDEGSRLFLGTIHPRPEDEAIGTPYPEYQLRNVKVEVERIRARAKAQDAAFNRIAQQFIDAAGLDDVVKPGYECPESAEVMQGIKGGATE